MSVEVPELVYEGLQEVLENDDVNEYHHTDARRWLFMNEYYPAAGWIRDNHLEYSEGLLNGFEKEEDNETQERESPEVR